MSGLSASLGREMFCTLRFLVPLLLIIGLSACEPSFSLAWSKNFNNSIKDSCIRDALTSVSGKVSQGSYISDGARGFPKGVTVRQFGYSDPHGEGHFDFDIARIDASHTRIYHSFEKLGNRPNDEYIRVSAALLKKNNEKIAAKCDLEFSEADFQEK